MLDLPLARYRALLGTYLVPHRRLLALLGLLLLVSTGLRLANPQVIRAFLDESQRPDASLLWLGLAAAAFLAIGLLDRAAAVLSVYVGENLGWLATNDLRADLARHCLELDLSFHKRHPPGELIERLDGDVTALAGFFSGFTVQVVSNLLLLVATLVVLFTISPLVGGVMVALVGVIFGALGALQRITVRRWTAERQASAAQLGFLEEHLIATEDLRGNGAEDYAIGRLLDLADDYLRKNRAAQLGSTLTGGTANFLLVVAYGLGLALGASLYLGGAISIGAAYAIVAYVGTLAGPLRGLREQLQDLQRATASVYRVDALRSERRRVRETGQSRLPAGALSVAMDDVSFAYDDAEPGANGDAGAAGPPVLRDVSLRVEPGRALGILGRTGSGKSTLIRLLARLYDPLRGVIALGGLDLREVALADLRRRVGVVSQEVQIFQASVRENLTLFDPRLDDATIRRALAALDLLDWIDGLPRGLDTPLGAGGIGLSAGEAQLLAFARVFLRDPGLVILDEASSRLDPATERHLERAIDGLVRGRTAIIIAHRLDTLRRVDDVLVLEGGDVVESGPRGQLAADPSSRFARLLRAGLTEVLA